MASDSDEELSDEQVHELLRQAETRMREAQELAHQASDSADAVYRLPKLDPGVIVQPYIQTVDGVARVDPSRLVNDDDRSKANAVRKVEDPLKIKKRKDEEKKATTGPEWFNLPKTELTPELRRDLKLLKMRDVIDPKRFYKKSGKTSEVPEFSQIGTIIEGPTEYYTGRLLNKERKNTFADEVLATEAKTGRFKSKYNDIQASKTSGKKAYYKALKEKRKKSTGKG
ncbi:rRNA-processing protein FCF2 [Lophium mytilinum]|uniref:rRNA-processing protein FCF2 n=1 Tax=Lophium mytilinum TaxID=390894 RepID=A0A6A6QEL6_9PEZI|nr:rRNA-processing protein FCF2 [Lophium mytilinum]